MRVVVPTGGAHRRPRNQNRPSRIATVAALGLMGVAGVIMASYRPISGFEAILAGRVVGAVLSEHTRAFPAQAMVVLHATDTRAIGLRITPQCTSTFLIAPMVIAAAVLLWLRPRQYRRVLVGLLITVVLLFATNQLRILGLGALVEAVGFDRGYYWGHTILGSMVSVVGGGASLLTFVYWTLARGEALRAQPRREPGSAGGRR